MTWSAKWNRSLHVTFGIRQRCAMLRCSHHFHGCPAWGHLREVPMVVFAGASVIDHQPMLRNPHPKNGTSTKANTWLWTTCFLLETDICERCWSVPTGYTDSLGPLRSCFWYSGLCENSSTLLFQSWQIRMVNQNLGCLHVAIAFPHRIAPNNITWALDRIHSIWVSRLPTLSWNWSRENWEPETSRHHRNHGVYMVFHCFFTIRCRAFLWFSADFPMIGWRLATLRKRGAVPWGGRWGWSWSWGKVWQLDVLIYRNL